MTHILPPTGLGELRALFPGWQCWQGRQTGTFWACPPPGHPVRALVNAGTAGELAAKIREATGWAHHE